VMTSQATMSKVIIGIHGMRNKPDANLLKRWWVESIHEGLRLNGYRNKNFKFELVYWADLIYPEPLSPSVNDPKNKLWIEFPYVPSAVVNRKKPSVVRKKLLDALEKQTDRIFLNPDGSLNFESITDKIFHRFFRDLEIYFSENCINKNYYQFKAKDVMLDRIVKVLKKYKRRDILVIGHSMGTILAYDALTCRIPDLRIDTLVTAGSPLGLPPIMKKLMIEQNVHTEFYKPPKAPENIKRKWYNLSDLTDKIALNYSLSDDYDPNSHGVWPIDLVVNNDYQVDGRPNSPKSYGYLRSPEMAEIISEFLSGKGESVFEKLKLAWEWMKGKLRFKSIQE
jgi:hypothetical protein